MSSATHQFTGKTAFVSGAASGIGRATARKLAAGGARVVFTDIDETGGRALENELHALGADARFILCDAMKEEEVKAALDGAFAINKRLDIAINNVGTAIGPHHIHETNLEDWREAIN